MSSKAKGSEPATAAKKSVRAARVKALRAGKVSAKVKNAGAPAEPRLGKQHSALSAKVKAALPAKAVLRPRAAQQISPELRRLVTRVADWAGGPVQALAWCREVGIAALGGLTAEELVKAGREDAVYAFLDHISVGGYS